MIAAVTIPPRSEHGEILDRNLGELDAECPECGHEGLGRWANEGVSEISLLCVECGHTIRGREAVEEVAR